jgi:hypothetical protein
LQGPPKFTQIGIFGLKTNHLATVPPSFFHESSLRPVDLMPMAMLTSRYVHLKNAKDGQVQMKAGI